MTGDSSIHRQAWAQSALPVFVFEKM